MTSFKDMAALSSRNFLSPFQNKVQLGAIIILATLVALFRLSNGDLSTEAPSRRSIRTVEAPTSIDKPTTRARMKDEADPFADILNAPAPPAKSNSTAPTPNNLSDVRKALGLE